VPALDGLRDDHPPKTTSRADDEQLHLPEPTVDGKAVRFWILRRARSAGVRGLRQPSRHGPDGVEDRARNARGTADGQWRRAAVSAGNGKRQLGACESFLGSALNRLCTGDADLLAAKA